jgi:hypothetical protein
MEFFFFGTRANLSYLNPRVWMSFFAATKCSFFLIPDFLFKKNIYLWPVGLPGPRHMAMEAKTRFPQESPEN